MVRGITTVGGQSEESHPIDGTDEHVALHGGRALFDSTSALVLGRIVVAVLGWAGTVLIARDLSTEAFGQFTLVFSLLGMLTVVTDLGVGRLVIGGLVDPTQDRPVLAGTYVILRTVLGLIGYALVMVAVVAMGYPDPVVKATAVGGLVVILATPNDAYSAAFQVTGTLRRLAVADIFAQLAQVSLTVALVLRGSGIVWYTVPAVLNVALIMVWKVPAAHRLIPFRYHFDWPLARRLLREAVPLSAGAAFATLYYRIDSVMLSHLADFEAVGLYGVAYKFVDLVHFVPASLAVAILAPLAAAWPRRPEEFVGHVRSGIVISAVIGGGVLVGFWLFATQAVTLLYGPDFAAAGPVTGIIVTGETLAFGSSLLIVVLVAVGRQAAYPLITLAGLVLNVVLNLMVIPRHGVRGAAFSTLFTEAVVLGALIWWVGRPGDVLPRGLRRLWLLAVPVAAGLGIGAVLEPRVPWILAAIIAGSVYLAGVHLLRIPGRGGLRDLLAGPGA